MSQLTSSSAHSAIPKAATSPPTKPVMNPPSIGLLGRVPREIRDFVYDSVVLTITSPGTKSNHLLIRKLAQSPLARTSKQICTEFFEVFFRRTGPIEVTGEKELFQCLDVIVHRIDMAGPGNNIVSQIKGLSIVHATFPYERTKIEVLDRSLAKQTGRLRHFHSICGLPVEKISLYMVHHGFASGLEAQDHCRVVARLRYESMTMNRQSKSLKPKWRRLKLQSSLTSMVCFSGLFPRLQSNQLGICGALSFSTPKNITCRTWSKSRRVGEKLEDLLKTAQEWDSLAQKSEQTPQSRRKARWNKELGLDITMVYKIWENHSSKTAKSCCSEERIKKNSCSKTHQLNNAFCNSFVIFVSAKSEQLISDTKEQGSLDLKIRVLSSFPKVSSTWHLIATVFHVNGCFFFFFKIPLLYSHVQKRLL